MSLIQDLAKAKHLTGRQKEIRDYFLNHPECVIRMSCEDVGRATFSSAATVTRFCQKFGFSGYPEFRLHFLSDIKNGRGASPVELIHLSEAETIASLLEKASSIQTEALKAAREALSVSQALRLRQLLLGCSQVDFYAYDWTSHLAAYGRNLLFHAGKNAAVFDDKVTRLLRAMTPLEGRLAVRLSPYGDSRGLVELTRRLKENGTKIIIITSQKDSALGSAADESLYAPADMHPDRMGFGAFTVAAAKSAALEKLEC